MPFGQQESKSEERNIKYELTVGVSWGRPYMRKFLSSRKRYSSAHRLEGEFKCRYCKLNPRSPAAGEFIEVDRCPQFGGETMAGSFTGMHSAIAFRFRLRPNRRKVQRPRSLRLLGGRTKVSSGRLSVRFRVPRFDLNPW